MDVRAGLNDYFARLTPEQRAAHGGLNPTPDTLQKRWVGARAAKKEAYAADEPARAARAETRAAEERARADARVATLAELTELTEEETAALREGGKVGDSARRGVVARARDVEMLTEGKAAEVLKRQQGRKHSANHRKKKKAKVEGLMHDEARLMERAAGLLADLERGGSTVLDLSLIHI